MSIDINNTNITIKENGILKTEEEILLEYFNNIVKECRKTTKGKTYDELDEGESYNRFQNRLGFFEDQLNNTIHELQEQISYKKHKTLLQELEEQDCLYSWDYTDKPTDDLNTYVKCLRKKLKAVIKIYSEHELKAGLIRGYDY